MHTECSEGERFDPPMLLSRQTREEEDKMPVVLLWAVPAVIAVGGGIYLITHLH